ncbi:hypothetical protein D3C80_2147040 [compost metagenome]
MAFVDKLGAPVSVLIEVIRIRREWGEADSNKTGLTAAVSAQDHLSFSLRCNLDGLLSVERGTVTVN